MISFKYTCLTCLFVGTTIARISSIKHIQSAVSRANKVKAVGLGHSWWKENFCAANDGVTIPIGGASDMKQVSVNREKTLAKIGCGITIRDVLTKLEKVGYTLPTFPWYIDQTLCGAIATGSHGSSLKFGSLSSEEMLLEMEVVLASGELKKISRKDDKELFSAFAVSAGRLGVIVSVTMRIERNSRTERHVEVKSTEALIEEIDNAAKEYKKNNFRITESLMNRLDTTQFLWFLTRGDAKNAVWRARFVTRPSIAKDATAFSAAEDEYWEGKIQDFNEANETPENAAQRSLGRFQERLWSRSRNQNNGGLSTPNVQMYQTTQYDRQPRNVEQRGEVPQLSSPSSSELVGYLLEKDWLPAQDLSKRDALVSQRFEMSSNAPDANMYDQYEVAVPLEKAADCMRAVYAKSQEMFGNTRETIARAGLRVPILIRIVKAEPENLLSLSYDGVKVYFNYEDYLKYSSRSQNEPNKAFREISTVLLSTKCSSGRNHWGKAKDYETLAKVSHSVSKQFSENFCSFGCAAKALDPLRKFESLWQRGWKWDSKALECGCYKDALKSEFVYDSARCGWWCGDSRF